MKYFIIYYSTTLKFFSRSIHIVDLIHSFKLSGYYFKAVSGFLCCSKRGGIIYLWVKVVLFFWEKF